MMLPVQSEPRLKCGTEGDVKEVRVPDKRLQPIGEKQKLRLQ